MRDDAKDPPGRRLANGHFVPRGGRKPQKRGDQAVARGQSTATAEAKVRYLATLRETCSVSAAVAATGRTRWAVRGWIDRDPAFKEADALAREEVVARLEKEAVRRAVEGVPEPIVSGGKILGEKMTYSDPLLKTLLAAADPERFRPGPQVNVATAGAIVFTPEQKGRFMSEFCRNLLTVDTRGAAERKAEPDPYKRWPQTIEGEAESDQGAQ